MTGIIGVGYGSSVYAGYTGYSNENVQANKPVVNPGESTVVTPGRKSSPAECETCKNRKYQDGSDEMVSFKSAAHISPEASANRSMLAMHTKKLLRETARCWPPTLP